MIGPRVSLPEKVAREPLAERDRRGAMISSSDMVMVSRERAAAAEVAAPRPKVARLGRRRHRRRLLYISMYEPGRNHRRHEPDEAIQDELHRARIRTTRAIRHRGQDE